MAVKKNNLRFYYFLALTIITVIASIIFVIALKVDYYKSSIFRYIFIFLLIKFAIQIILLIYALKRILKNEDEKSYDERELFIILKAAAIGGIVGFSLSPLVYIFVFILPQYLTIATVTYALLIDFTTNIASIVYQKRI